MDDLQPVRCVHCRTTVLVRKSSPTQTTIQWRGDSTSCPEIAGEAAAGLHTGRVAGCAQLRASIDAAVAAGVVSDGYGLQP